MADYADIVGALEAFWGRLDTRQLHHIRTLHHPMFVHEFGDTALVIRGPDEAVVAYLLGFVAPAAVHRKHMSPDCQRFTLREVRRTVSIIIHW